MQPSRRAGARRICWILAALLPLSACGGETDTGEGVGEEEPSRDVPTARLPNDTAGALVARAIRAHGGWEAWTSVRTVEYEKTTVYRPPDGSPPDTTVERHRYVLHPSPRIRIDRRTEHGTTVLAYDGERARTFVDGRLVDTPEAAEEASYTTLGSHFVFALPFKLTDPGARLEHLGRDTLNGAGPVEVVEVTYGEGPDAHTWRHYFDRESGRLAASWLNRGPGLQSFTEYVEYGGAGGLDVVLRRVGYASNAEAERLERTTLYRHQDHRFDVSLPDSIFTPGAS